MQLGKYVHEKFFCAPPPFVLPPRASLPGTSLGLGGADLWICAIVLSIPPHRRPRASVEWEDITESLLTECVALDSSRQRSTTRWLDSLVQGCRK